METVVRDVECEGLRVMVKVDDDPHLIASVYGYVIERPVRRADGGIVGYGEPVEYLWKVWENADRCLEEGLSRARTIAAKEASMMSGLAGSFPGTS